MPEPKAHPEPASGSLAGRRLLVVDDEADARQLIEHLLRGAGAEVRVVASAAEALEAISSFLPDVLLSDIAMPVENGYELIRAVRSLPEGAGGRVPAIALTAFARGEDRHRALSAGFQRHLAKPVDQGELLEVIRAVLERD
jgi:CheY-like chemotaxis protein